MRPNVPGNRRAPAGLCRWWRVRARPHRLGDYEPFRRLASNAETFANVSALNSD
jgi:hypothetical protein